MRITVNLESKNYDIFLEAGIIENINEHFDLTCRKILIITDDGVPSDYLEIVLNQCVTAYQYIIKQGESSKSLENFEKISEFMLVNGFNRKDLIIALGGGVVGDLSGFIASAYMRGIDYISIPTTTLSQIDSSIGGKTAVNVGKFKNMIGAFHQPKTVFIDPNTLNTLCSRHFFNGLVEALKAGLIHDKGLFNLFLKGDFENDLTEIIHRAVLVKRDIVEEDEKEEHIRKILNFGHTIGHGIETFNNFEFYHGECVACGMIPMIRDYHIKKSVCSIIEKMGIDTHIDYDLDEVLKIVKHDKKASSGSITIVTVSQIGQAELEEVSFDRLYEIMEGC